MNPLIQRLTLSAFAFTPLLTLTGCIVQDIYDQIELSNQQLGSISETLTKIERTNTLLASIEFELDSIDGKLATIDQNLGSVNTRMADLQVVLDAVSEHLASLRKTINNIDSTIPFLKLSGDNDEEKATLEDGTAQPATDPVTDLGTDPDTEASPTTTNPQPASQSDSKQGPPA